MAYAALWILAVSFGWIEGSVVVYLREIYAREIALHGTAGVVLNVPVTLASLPAPLVAIEIAREASTLVLLAAVAWLAGRRVADRAGAFLLEFGIWDLTYYATLRMVLGWPDRLTTWDVLFLIPSPWVAPVWAPATVAILFVAAGTFLFWTSERDRRYRWTDGAVLIASALVTVAAFLFGSNAAIDHRFPESFPIWLFWTGVFLGVGWFVGVERAAVRPPERPWVGVHVRTVLPPSEPLSDRSAIAEYGEQRRHLDALLQEAHGLGERFDRLGHGLLAHPERMIVGLPDRPLENPDEWEILPSHPLPSIDQLAALTADIRQVRATVDDLKERLILTGRADLVEEPNGFFH